MKHSGTSLAPHHPETGVDEVTNMDDQMEMRLAVVIVAALAAIAVWFLMRRRKTAALRARFGQEYDRLLQTTKSPAKAEQELLDRQQRVQSFSLRSLSREEGDRFTQAWRTVQSRFVDDPPTAVNEADRLIEEVMRARGYPVEDTAHRLDDLSVDHAAVVSHYRTGREIVVRHGRGEASTEDLRKAMVHYRALFDELVVTHPGDVRRAS
jgi:hypothetical protein